MKRAIMVAAGLLVLTVAAFVTAAGAGASDDSLQASSKWQSPSEDLMEVLHAP
jgi:hypothetical protein